MTFEFINQQLAQQHQQARFRQLHCVTEQKDGYISVAGEKYLNFSSNDYLGLNHHPKINQAMQEGIDKFGVCASASSLVTGYQYAHQSLENDICTWLNKPRCVLYSSGFAANLGVLQALGQESAAFWLDKLSHASLIDGALASKAKVKRFLHNDMKQLGSFLAKATQVTKVQVNSNDVLEQAFEQNNEQSLPQNKHPDNNLIISEGVFSMDGDQAKIAELLRLAKKYQAWLYIDDAHSIGVVGQQGEGSLHYAKESQSNSIDIVMANFGKAIATNGAFVACEENVAEHLVNFSRHYIYSTAMSPAIAWATKTSIALIKKEQWRRDKIMELSELFISKLDPNIQIIPSQSSIHAIIIGSEIKTMEICQKLKEKGVWLTAIRPPTVLNNSSRLRVTICASHNSNNINYLAKCLNEVCL